MADPDWLDYQKLAAEIYADLEMGTGAVVTHDDKIRGLESGTDRQIDVSIRTAVAGHDILIIVQAKNLARPADINVVGEFQAVIMDVRAAKGVLICSSGFTSTAMEYGRKLNIDLCTAHDIQHRKWGADLRIPLLWVEFTGDVSLDMALVADAPNPEPISLDHDAGKWLTSVDGGLTTTAISELLATAWNAKAANRTPGVLHQLDVARPGMKVRLGDSYWCPVGSLTCAYAARRTGWLGTFSFSQGRGIFNRGAGTIRARVAITDKDLPLRRDDSWSSVDNPDAVWEAAAKTPMLRIEKDIGPESFTFERLEMISEDDDGPGDAELT